MTYLLILIAYAMLMILLGVIVSRRVQTSGDFFVAGRGLSAGLVFSTLLAANIGAGSTVGATGLGYRDGLSAWWWVGSAGIGSMILAFTVGPKIWHIARENNLYTVGDYLEFRYNKAVRGLASVLLWIGSLAILAGQLIAIAWVLNVTAGLSKPLGCAIGATVATLYFASGGLFGTARVNALQLVIKLIGFGLAAIYLFDDFINYELYKTPLTESESRWYQMHQSFTGIGTSEILKMLVILVPSFVISPGLLQKVFGAGNEKAVKSGVFLNALGLLGFAIVPPLLGIVAHSYFPALDNRELALPMLLTNHLPLWLGGLLLGAIFAAEVSTADAVLFMLSTSLSKDLYQSFLYPQATDKELMRVVRITAVGCGILGALLGIWLPSVISALTIFYTLLTAALLLPLVVGLYSSRVTANNALATMIISVAVTFLVWQFSANGEGFWKVPSVVFGVAAGAVIMMIWRLIQQVRSGNAALGG